MSANFPDATIRDLPQEPRHLAVRSIPPMPASAHQSQSEQEARDDQGTTPHEASEDKPFRAAKAMAGVRPTTGSTGCAARARYDAWRLRCLRRILLNAVTVVAAGLFLATSSCGGRVATSLWVMSVAMTERTTCS
jgi:hypothetical protein